MLGTDTGKNSEFYFIPRALDCYPLSYREGVVCTYDIWLSVCQKGVIYYEHFFFFRFWREKLHLTEDSDIFVDHFRCSYIGIINS